MRSAVLLFVLCSSQIAAPLALAVEQCKRHPQNVIPASALQNQRSASIGAEGHCHQGVPCNLYPQSGKVCFNAPAGFGIVASYCQVGQDVDGAARAPCGPFAPSECKWDSGAIFDNFQLNAAIPAGVDGPVPWSCVEGVNFHQDNTRYFDVFFEVVKLR